ncbi:MAG: cell division protein FtsZ, partial [Roseivivax sp.]|nr:cell division protein FtsZ [Roseivivax sp.]
ITGGHDLTLFELDEAANRIRDEVDPDANIIVGSTLDDSMQGVMRVSVVATGIDAVVSHQEAPLPRRSLAQPLSSHAAEEAPAPAPAPKAAAPAARTSQPERSLFDREEDEELIESGPESLPSYYDSQRAQASRAVADDLPPPAYRPQRVAEDSIEAVQEAPAQVMRKAVGGTPTPEVMARLQAAAGRGRASAAPAPQQVEDHEADRQSRFGGINSLINRMTGHGSEAPVQRRQPPVTQAPARHTDEEGDHERIEIPAFLRRQAN